MAYSLELQPQSGADKAREMLVYGLGVIERQWRYLLYPVLITIVVALAVVKLSPTTYTTKALILIQSANRPVGAGLQSAANVSRQAVLDQIAALDAWLKSDEVVGNLLPRLVDPASIATPEGIEVQTKILRSSLTMELVGGSAIEMRLEGSKPRGLASKLELIVERLMEGLTRPEKGILNSMQFVELQRKEALAAADSALGRGLLRAGIPDTDKVRNILKQINDLKLQMINNESSYAAGSANSESLARNLRNLRAELSEDQKVANQLELLYAEYHIASANAADLKRNFRPNQANYIGIFDSPENLLLVGRPQDPIYGTRSAKKLAIAAILLSVLAALAMAGMRELVNRRLFLTAQFEAASGLPVVARIAP